MDGSTKENLPKQEENVKKQLKYCRSPLKDFTNVFLEKVCSLQHFKFISGTTYCLYKTFTE